MLCNVLAIMGGLVMFFYYGWLGNVLGNVLAIMGGLVMFLVMLLW